MLNFSCKSRQGAETMAPAINSADEAVNKADSILSKHCVVRRLEKAKRKGDIWDVEFDVGALLTSIIKVSVDAKTGKILEVAKEISK
jgi:hypothetical protein